MSNKIPTAEQFFLQKAKELRSDENDMPRWMIEESKNLIKLHVEAALKAAAKDAKTVKD